MIKLCNFFEKSNMKKKKKSLERNFERGKEDNVC